MSIFLSILLHILVIIFIFLAPRNTKKEDTIVKVTAISEKEFKKQVVQTDDNQKEEDPGETKFLSKKNHKTEKETRAKKTDKFKNNQSSKEKDVPPGGDGFLPSKPTKLHKPGDDSATDDDLKGLSIGPGTILNSKEYKFYNYFERIREQLVSRWRPKIREAIKKVKKQKEKAKETISEGSKITKLKVIVNKKGEILSIEKMWSSEFPEFDDAAIESFNESAPFASPPKELLEKDETIIIDWDFTVDMEKAPIVGFGGNRI